ncbi:hypothetical protein IQ06DRAFT_40581 [Phaeosphaeriaceae sp. SRC1lsM3a]|nr:hypothetical protein IQ06DRAFT_40581 [Stagonospora sp. SRC1lsM3a]
MDGTYTDLLDRVAVIADIRDQHCPYYLRTSQAAMYPTHAPLPGYLQRLPSSEKITSNHFSGPSQTLHSQSRSGMTSMCRVPVFSPWGLTSLYRGKRLDISSSTQARGRAKGSTLTSSYCVCTRHEQWLEGYDPLISWRETLYRHQVVSGSHSQQVRYADAAEA